MAKNTGLMVLGGLGIAGLVYYFAIKKPKVEVKEAFASIQTQLIQAWVQRGSKWYVYDPTDPINSDLTYVQSGEKVSLQVSAICTLTYEGKSVSLLVGWNHIKW